MGGSLEKYADELRPEVNDQVFLGYFDNARAETTLSLLGHGTNFSLIIIRSSIPTKAIMNMQETISMHVDQCIGSPF